MNHETLGYVFGYGTLANPDDWLILRDGDRFSSAVYLHILGYRRHWDIAAENCDREHDNKYHADVATGERPDIRVAALGLEEAPGVRCNGMAIPVDDRRLDWFDRREGKLYRRKLVPRDRVDKSLGLPVWAYFPKPEAIRSFVEGLAAGKVFYPTYYENMMEEVFGALGEEALEDYRHSTRPPRCPRRDLELVRASGDAGI